MEDSEILAIMEDLDVPQFKIGMKKFKNSIQAAIDTDPEYDGEADEFLDAMHNLQDALSPVNSLKAFTVNEFRKNILSDLLTYFRAFMIVKQKQNESENEEDDEHIFQRQLEDIDVEDFKQELAEFKNEILDNFDLGPEADSEMKQVKSEIIELIEKLQKTFAAVHSIIDLDSEELEAIRPDFEQYIDFTDILKASDEINEDDLEFDEEDDSYFDDDSDFEEDSEFEDDSKFDDDSDFDDEEDEDDFADDEQLRGLHNQFYEQFYSSSQFHDLSENQQSDADFILECLSDALAYEDAMDPLSWNQNHLKEVCLEWFPRKVSAQISLFNNVGPVLIAFFNFLSQKKLLKQAWKLEDCLKMIKDEIPKLAKNPVNWGMSKTIAMKAIEENVDLSNEQEKNAFLMRCNEQILTSRT